MNWEEFLFNNLGRLNPRLVAWFEKRLRKISSVNQMIEKEYDEMMADLEGSLKPYRGEFPSFTEIPATGRGRDEILREMEALHTHEQSLWQDGFVSGAVYHGNQEHIDFLNKVYAINSQSNPLHADVWPSATKFESEIVAMTADMLGGADRSESFIRRDRKHHAGDENLPRSRPPGKRYYPARNGCSRHGARRIRQGQPIFQHQNGAHPCR